MDKNTVQEVDFHDIIEGIRPDAPPDLSRQKEKRLRMPCGIRRMYRDIRSQNLQNQKCGKMTVLTISQMKNVPRRSSF